MNHAPTFTHATFIEPLAGLQVRAVDCGNESRSGEAASEVAAEVSYCANWTPGAICGLDVDASEREGHNGSHGEADADGLNAGRALVEDGDGSQRRRLFGR